MFPRFTLLLLVLSASCLFGATPLPPYAAFPPVFVSDPSWERVEGFGREDFPMPNDALPKSVEGKHWSLQLRAEPPLELDPEPTWARLRRHFTGTGWQVVSESGAKVLHLRANAVDAWMKVDVLDS